MRIRPKLLHQYLFDVELALHGIGQAVEQLTNPHVPARLREAMVVALGFARNAHLDRSDTVHPGCRVDPAGGRCTTPCDGRRRGRGPRPGPSGWRPAGRVRWRPSQLAEPGLELAHPAGRG